ncbi:MAG: hypothetical protein WA624_01515, partial [Methylocella sp.]
MLCFYGHCHDVSIRIDGGHGEALCLGVWPRLKTSMMRILLPQHGQVGVWDSGSAVAGSALVGCWSCIGAAAAFAISAAVTP